METNHPVESEIEQLKILCNSLARIAFRDALEDLHAEGRITHEDFEKIMPRARAELVLPVLMMFGKASPDDTMVKLWISRINTEWNNYKDEENDWTEFYQTLKVFNGLITDKLLREEVERL